MRSFADFPQLCAVYAGVRTAYLSLHPIVIAESGVEETFEGNERGRDQG
jgi:hypothetical protein